MKPTKIATLLNISIATVEEALTEPPSMDDITTAEQAQEAYVRAPEGSEAERLAMVKWLSLCTTSEQARKAYEAASYGAELQRLAMVKWLSFCKDIAQFQEAFNCTSSGSESGRLTIRKLAEMPDEE